MKTSQQRHPLHRSGEIIRDKALGLRLATNGDSETDRPLGGLLSSSIRRFFWRREPLTLPASCRFPVASLLSSRACFPRRRPPPAPGEGRAAAGQPALALPLYSPSHAGATVFCRQVRAATAHQLAHLLYHVLRYGEAYVKQTEAADAEPTQQREEKQLQRSAKEWGYTLTKVKTTAAPPQ